MLFNSPLQRALVLGLASGGDLRRQLEPLGSYRVRTEDDARAVLAALKRFPRPETDSLPALQAVVDLFRQIGPVDCPAAQLLRKRGAQELRRVFDELMRDLTTKNAGFTILRILATLAEYGTRQCAERVVKAARMGIGRDEYRWGVILTKISAHHRQRDFVFDSLSRPLPRDFIALPLLDVANEFAREYGLQHHPFDSEQGQSKLRQWLTSRFVERVPYARSAAMALPFLHGTERNSLLGLARDHADLRVRINAAWASAAVGQEIGVNMLRAFCRDPICFNEASECLMSLDRTDDLPGVVDDEDSDFLAKAEFAAMFAERDFRGSLPDELTIVDRRRLFWPPTGRKTTLRLIRYVVHDPYGLEPDDVGCGVVGATVGHYPVFHCDQLPPEDVYAIHCFTEAKLEHRIVNPAEYASMLLQWRHEPLEDAEVVRLVDIPARWNYGRRFVALAEAKINGQEGWAVLDGPQSAWYPASEMPEDQHELAPLMIHVGRRMLGLRGRPDRKKYLVDSPPQEPSPSRVVEVYEELLSEFTAGDDDLPLLINRGDCALTEHMQSYAAARKQLGFEAEEDALVRVFHTILETVLVLPPGAVQGAFCSSGPLGLNFDAYVDAMLSLGRQEELVATIKLLEPCWSSCMRRADLGAAASRAGDLHLAERLLLVFRDSQEVYCSTGVTLLVKLWHQQGRPADARDLLIDCMRKLNEHARDRFGFDRRLSAERYLEYRTQFSEMFADSGQLLEQLGLPASVATTLDGLYW